MIKESIKMSWTNIVHNKMRSALTILGIVIGVASVIALITIVQAATVSVTSTVASLGANKITITATGTPLKPGLSATDITAISQIANIDGVSPTSSSKTSIVYNKTVYENVSIQGKNEVYFAKTDKLIATGRAINIYDIQNKNKVCLIGNNIVSELFYAQDPIGKTLTFGGVDYTVIGTLQKSSSGFDLNSNNNSVIIPYTTAMSFQGTRYINSLDVYITEGSDAASVTSDIQNLLNQAFNNNSDGFSIINLQSYLDIISQITGMLSLMLAGIASISLLVGGIGIMNMMLVSVTERTTEIGLRKALGAKPNRIQLQFLLESIFLSLFGGIIGFGLGVLIAYIACILMTVSFSIAPSTVLLAMAFSVTVGIVFGLAPANKASKLNPIDALRSI
jgi:putative ABC transport system permease protein